jgi:hypothetical protein
MTGGAERHYRDTTASGVGHTAFQPLRACPAFATPADGKVAKG